MIVDIIESGVIWVNQGEKAMVPHFNSHLGVI
jgi:hypothetical protein